MIRVQLIRRKAKETRLYCKTVALISPMIRFYSLSVIIHISLLIGLIWLKSAPNKPVPRPMMLEFFAFDSDGDLVAREQKISRKAVSDLSKEASREKQTVSLQKNEKQGQDNEDIEEIKPSQGGSQNQQRVTYEQELQSYIARNRFYPRKALALEQTGVVTLRLKINAEGEFIDVKLEENSGHPILDNAALELLKKLKNFKPLPKSYVGKNDFIIPIRYQMNR